MQTRSCIDDIAKQGLAVQTIACNLRFTAKTPYSESDISKKDVTTT